MLGAGECSKTFASAQAGRRARKDDGAATPRQHDLRRFATHQEAAEAGHLPDLGVDASGGLGGAEANIGADVEDRHFDRRDVLLDLLHQRDHVVLLARVGAEAVRLAAFGPDLVTRGWSLSTVRRVTHAM